MAVPKEYRFSAKELSDLSKLPELGVTSLRVDDDAITGSKNSFLFFLKQAVEKAPEVFYTFYVDYGVLDKEICAFLTEDLHFCKMPKQNHWQTAKTFSEKLNY